MPPAGQPVLLYNANAANQPLEEYRVFVMPQDGNAADDLSACTHWMHLPEPPNDEQAEAIRFVADSVVSHHLPSDANAQAFDFNITVEGKAYQVTYQKDAEGYWAFNSYQ